MHPFAQAIIAVFVGLVVLGPVEVELAPEALDNAPTTTRGNFAQQPSPDSVTPIRMSNRPVHLVYADLDRPTPPNTQSLANLAAQDRVVSGVAPVSLAFAITASPPILQPELTAQPTQVMQKDGPTEVLFDRSPVNVSTASNSARARVDVSAGLIESDAGFLPINALRKFAGVNRLAQPKLSRAAPLFPIPLERQLLITETSEPPSPYSPRMINAEFVHLRAAPNANAEIIAQLNPGDWVLFAGVTQGNWSQVLSPDGEDVWVYTPYLSLPDVGVD